MNTHSNTRLGELALSGDIKAAQQGDKTAITRLIEKTQNTITGIALAIVKDIDNSEEIAQQVYISVWKNIKRLKNPDSFLPWIRQTTRYTAYNFIRDHKTSERINSAEAEVLLAALCAPDIYNDVPLERRQQSLIMHELLNRLPEESREVLLLYYREEKSCQQVGQLLGLTESNVRKKLSRARAMLKAPLENKLSELILLSAPTVGFTSFVLGAFTGTSPVTAATLGVSYASGKSSLAAKLSALLSGAFLGIASAALAIFWGTHRTLKTIDGETAKQTLRRYRNQTIVWLIFSGALLTAAYEFSVDWQAPLAAYTLFCIGLLIQSRKTSQHIAQNLTQDKQKYRKRHLLCGTLGSLLGCIAGMAGLIIGLINQGRL